MATHLRLKVCGNEETVGHCGEFCDEAAQAWTRAACRELEALPLVGEVHTDSWFANWHGGQFAEQAKARGFERFGLVVCTGATVTVTDSEGDEAEESRRWADLPAEDRARYEEAIWAAITVANAERDKVQAAHEALIAEAEADSDEN